METKDEIRARLPIEQLVGEYCQLKKKGRNFVALCPFHQDSNPSLLVSPDKGIAYCFACQSGGDIFSFVQKIEGVDFPEAIKILAEKAGVEIKHERRVPSVTKDERDRLKECLVEASTYYIQSLRAYEPARSYLEERGVDASLQERFGIGFAPGSFSSTYDHLLKKGYSRTDIVRAGLGVQRELSEEKIYDRFRNRVMFPIRNAQGIIIGFGGRTLGDDDAKYVNSPESPLYHKSSVLFGLFEAKEAIRKTKRVILVEGYFDCIACHKAGVENVVAVSGTALTEEHVRILRRTADEVVLCLDQDNAGHLAAARAFALLARAGFSILSVSLPTKDPDELVQKDPRAFAALIAHDVEPYISTVIRTLQMRPDLQSPRGKRAISEILFPLLDAVQSSVELRSTVQKASSAFGMVESELLSDFQTWKNASNVTQSTTIDQHDERSPGYSRIELCVGIALAYPVLSPLLTELIVEQGSSEASLIDAAMQTSEEREKIDPMILERLNVLALYAEEHFDRWNDQVATLELKKLIAHANRETVKRKQMQLVSALKEARMKGNADEESKLLLQYQKLLQLHSMARQQ